MYILGLLEKSVHHEISWFSIQYISVCAGVILIEAVNIEKRAQHQLFVGRNVCRL